MWCVQRKEGAVCCSWAMKEEAAGVTVEAGQTWGQNRHWVPSFRPPRARIARCLHPRSADLGGLWPSPPLLAECSCYSIQTPLYRESCAPDDLNSNGAAQTTPYSPQPDEAWGGLPHGGGMRSPQGLRAPPHFRHVLPTGHLAAHSKLHTSGPALSSSAGHALLFWSSLKLPEAKRQSPKPTRAVSLVKDAPASSEDWPGGATTTA